MTPAIVVEKLTKDFGAFRALDEVSFEVPVGAVTGFIGANGSGKTTTMRALLGLTPPTAGAAYFGDRTYRELRHPRRVVGAVVDRIGAHPSHSARAHLTMIAVAAGLPLHRVDETLDEVGLLDVADKALRTYSMGMTQRCALAAAMLGSPSTFVLDEPANGLDPAGIRWLRTTIRSWADDGKAVLISTHQLAELAAVVDHLVVLHEGRVVYHGPAATLTGAGQTLETAVFDLVADLSTRITTAEVTA